ncbi:MAG: alpha-glucosidase/alpha-galactosidase [Oscillospiraceae bacterium]|nr:alpha-glucosidase/alpha-galactosidase [Oscillospiraceae bacterium]
MFNKDKRTNIAYIGGGSVNFGWKLFSELAAEEIYATVQLYDVDKQLSLSNEVIGNKLREHPDCKSDIIYLAVDTPEEALKNADIVILSFTQGSLEEAVTEMHLPETYGIYQSVGEQTGPSGVIKALKTLPIYIKYTELIKNICPDAWVINLTNPMSVCVQMMYEIFPEIKLFGSTNELYPTLDLLVNICEKEFGVKNIRRRDIKYNLIGISGFSWFDEIIYDGNDIMPVFRKYAEKYCANGYETKPNEFKLNPYASANKIKFDLFLRYGCVPAVSDRIAADFCPAWYLKSPKTISSWKFSQTTVNYLKKLRLDKISRIKPLMNGDEMLRVGGGTTDCALQIRALMGLGNLITNVCTRNNGQVENLPTGSIVHTNALISKNSVKPVAAGKLSDEIYGLTIRHVINQKTIVKAVMERDLDIAFNAFLNDPLMSADLTEATELYKEMLSAVRTHLLYYC